MNKQEALKQIEEQRDMILELHGWGIFGYIKGVINQLDEPLKIELPKVEFKKSPEVKVPLFVADWIEYCKVKKITLAHALYRSEEAKNKSVYRWIVEGSGHQETFARAWLDGYEVEEEKRYRIVVKHTDRNCLKYDKYVRKWFFGIEEISSIVRKDHTRKELEEADFGWVFDCPGIEIEEVE